MKTETLQAAKPLRFKKNFLAEYLRRAPIALAVERSLECGIFSQQKIIPPAVDYGCGDGLFCDVLFDDSVDIGIDISKEDLAVAAKKGTYRKVYDNANRGAPISPRSVNTVICNSVLEHVQDLDGSLVQIYGMMADEGWLYVTVPSEQYDKHTVLYHLLVRLGQCGWAEKSRRLFNRFWGHIHCYPQRVWEKRFSDAGFRVIQCQRYAPKKICLLGNLCLPLAAPALITKRLFGRWILIGPLRRRYIRGVYRAIKKKLIHPKDEGALIFFVLQKNHAH